MAAQDHHLVMLQNLVKMFVEQIPFHGHLGISMLGDVEGDLNLRVDMSEHLIGNSLTKILHGGVIATLLDASGGLTAFASAIKKLETFPTPKQVQQLSRGATIDMRVDYLRPGTGQYFIAASEVLRSGNNVTVTRMSLKNNEGTLIAVGQGTYFIAMDT